MSYNPLNPNGQATMANSQPVVLASDQTSIPVAATLTGTTNGLALDATLTGGTQQTKITDGTNIANVNAVTGKNGIYIASNSATAAAVPATAFWVGVKDGSGNLQGLNAASVNGDAQAGGNALQTDLYIYNGSNFDRTRSATSANNTTGTGLLGAGLLEWDGTNYQRVPAARFAPASTVLNTYSIHLTTNTTTTPTAATAYISSIAISNEVAGTTSSITIQDKQGTPLKLVNGFATTALTTAPTIINFQTPVKMVSGIDIITAGAVAATVDVWINYYQ